MFGVVIIDDEPIIVRGLVQTVKWENWNCRIVGTAENGAEGISLIRELQPDIVITDISMPKMSGLDMIAGFKSEFPWIQVSILTGFRDFDYIQEALRLGVCGFLLKPSKMKELEEALDEMTERLKKNQQRNEEVKIYSQALKQENDEEQIDKPEPEMDDLLYSSQASSFIVKNAVEYIQAHYAETLRLVDVADKIYVSQWHLSKLLNKHTGKNFSEILNGIRIDRAKQLLKDPSLRIGDIAEEVGFLDMAHFSRVFKKQEGISAGEYRNKI